MYYIFVDPKILINYVILSIILILLTILSPKYNQLEIIRILLPIITSPALSITIGLLNRAFSILPIRLIRQSFEYTQSPSLKPRRFQILCPDIKYNRQMLLIFVYLRPIMPFSFLDNLLNFLVKIVHCFYYT